MDWLDFMQNIGSDKSSGVVDKTGVVKVLLKKKQQQTSNESDNNIIPTTSTRTKSETEINFFELVHKNIWRHSNDNAIFFLKDAKHPHK